MAFFDSFGTVNHPSAYLQIAMRMPKQYYSLDPKVRAKICDAILPKYFPDEAQELWNSDANEEGGVGKWFDFTVVVKSSDGLPTDEEIFTVIDEKLKDYAAILQHNNVISATTELIMNPDAMSDSPENWNDVAPARYEEKNGTIYCCHDMIVWQRDHATARPKRHAIKIDPTTVPDDSAGLNFTLYANLIAEIWWERPKQKPDQ